MTTSTDNAALNAAYEECQAVTKREARNFYYAFLTLPQPRRRAIYAAYAFSRLADDIADGDGAPLQKRSELAALRERLRDAYAGHPEGAILTALADAAITYDIPESLFQDIITGVEMDLEPRRFADFDELRHYCYHVASVVGLVSIRIFGYRDVPLAQETAVDFGLAMQLTNILRDLREDIERDRVYLPLNEMARFGYTEDDLRDGVVHERFRAMMRFQANRAQRYFDSASRLMPLLEPESRGCAEGLHHLYNRLLNRMASRGWDVFSKRVSLSSWEKLNLTCRLWTTARLRSVLKR